MLRAISEMANATIVCSVLEKPMSAASSRPFCRAVTMSASPWMGTCSSPGTIVIRGACAVQQRHAFFEIERGFHALQPKPELDHGEGDLGLNADDNGRGASQPGRVRNAPQRARREGIEHVEGRDIDDDTPAAKATDLLGERIPQLNQFAVGQRRLDRRDEDVALLEDGYRHRVTSSQSVKSRRRWRARPGAPASFRPPPGRPEGRPR